MIVSRSAVASSGRPLNTREIHSGCAPSSTRGRFDCTMSKGAALEMTAAARWAVSRLCSNSRAMSSSPATGRSVW